MVAIDGPASSFYASREGLAGFHPSSISRSVFSTTMMAVRRPQGPTAAHAEQAQRVEGEAEQSHRAKGADQATGTAMEGMSVAASSAGKGR